MNKLTLAGLRKLIAETIEEVKIEELQEASHDEAHHDKKDEAQHEVDEAQHEVDEGDMDEMMEADVEVGVHTNEDKHLEESAQLDRWRKLAGILKD